MILEAKDIIVFFENAIAVNEISISVKQSEVVGLFGPNSSGKSTILNVISGLLLDIQKKEKRKGGQRITIMGKIYFAERDVTKLWPHKRSKMGLVLCRERHSIFPESSVEENLRIAGFILNRKELRKRMDFVYSIFPHLRNLRSKKAGLLSGGEQQMLSISMALMPNPRLLLLDEPLFGLSPALYSEFLGALSNIKDAGTSILIAEQFAMPVLPLIDRAYVIESGSLVFQGSKKELLNSTEIYSAYLA